MEVAMDCVCIPVLFLPFTNSTPCLSRHDHKCLQPLPNVLRGDTSTSVDATGLNCPWRVLSETHLSLLYSPSLFCFPQLFTDLPCSRCVIEPCASKSLSQKKKKSSFLDNRKKAWRESYSEQIETFQVSVLSSA